MIILNGAIIFFIVAELLNVLILYFAPDLKKGNGVAVFKFWDKAKQNPDEQLFAQYMANWVAGSKLIFIALLVVILLFGNEATKLLSMVAMIFSIATYYFKLHPLIKKLDDADQLTTKGYSKILLAMITGFILIFIVALIVYIVL